MSTLEKGGKALESSLLVMTLATLVGCTRGEVNPHLNQDRPLQLEGLTDERFPAYTKIRTFVSSHYEEGGQGLIKIQEEISQSASKIYVVDVDKNCKLNTQLDQEGLPKYEDYLFALKVVTHSKVLNAFPDLAKCEDDFQEAISSSFMRVVSSFHQALNEKN